MRITVALLLLCSWSCAGSTSPDWWTNEKNYVAALKHMKAVAEKSKFDIMDALNLSKTHIYAITAPVPERITNVDRFLTSMGLSEHNRAPYVDAVDAITFPKNRTVESFVHQGIVDSNWNSPQYRQKVTLGRIGCQLSIVHVLTEFLKSPHQVAMVIEDDIMVQSGLNAKEARSLLAHMLAIPPDLWDIQYLGFCFACNTVMNFKHRSMSIRGALKGKDLWITRGVVQLCRHAILFNRHAAAVYLKEWMPMSGPGDVRLSEVVCETGESLTMHELTFVILSLFAFNK